MTYECAVCQKQWTTFIERCLFCGGKVSIREDGDKVVIGFSEVMIPSIGHDQAPYFVNLVRDSGTDRLELVKSFTKPEIGSKFESEERRSRETIAVVGTGPLGVGLATFFVKGGHPVILKSRSRAALSRAEAQIQGLLEKSYDGDDARKLLEQVTLTDDYDKVGDARIIVEAVAETAVAKEETLRLISLRAGDDAIIATNTSSLSIAGLSDAVERPDRFLGLHFFNPVDRMKLVEIVKGPKTSPTVVAQAIAWLESIGKLPVSTIDSPGFVVNRLLMPFINEAVGVLDQGVADRASIDQAICLGLNHPIGPLALADMIGLDICLAILEELYARFKDKKYEPDKLLIRMVEEGKLGKKTGEGFYNY